MRVVWTISDHSFSLFQYILGLIVWVGLKIDVNSLTSGPDKYLIPSGHFTDGNLLSQIPNNSQAHSRFSTILKMSIYRYSLRDVARWRIHRGDQLAIVTCDNIGDRTKIEFCTAYTVYYPYSYAYGMHRADSPYLATGVGSAWPQLWTGRTLAALASCLRGLAVSIDLK